jgi:hypothetical protein
MRKKYYLLPLFLSILSSCWWGAKRDPKPNYPIAGAKWQEVKLSIYNKTYHCLIFHDTTYQRPAFDTLDFAQFFNNGTAYMASHYDYSLHDSMYNGDPSHPYFYDTRGFIPEGSLYIIGSPGVRLDTVYYNGHDSLRIRSSRDNGMYYNEMDIYYARQAVQIR